MNLRLMVSILVMGCAWAMNSTAAQMLDDALQQMTLPELVAGARELGDPARGAIVFFQPQLACAKCHAVGNDNNPLGPDLTRLPGDVTDESLIESVLSPSKQIRQGYESVSVLTVDGRVISAIVVEQTPEKLVLRDVAREGELLTFDSSEIEEVKTNALSIMPAGQMNQLTSKQQFFDLVRYLIEIRDGGQERARQLQPSAALLAFTVPEYESHLDHAGLIGGWNEESFRRGEAIYNRVCANCHGTKDQPGSLPTSLRFAEGQFKNGSDPLSLYRTLTHGFGQMTPQSWMVPSQKYDVIHYIRQAYLAPHNPSQYTAIDAAYLAKLPQGDTFGPEPNTIEAWSAMDYGPSLTHTYEIPGGKPNFAYKGIAVRLDPGAGGVSRGRHWMVFDTDTLRVAAGWNSGPAHGSRGQSRSASSSEEPTKSPQPQADPQENFIDWRAIQFNGEHGVHPKIVGQIAFANPTGPGWANPADGQFRDDQRVLGRDDRRYGPLPRSWGRFKGLYHYDQQTIFSYSIGKAEILESPRVQSREGSPPLMLRTFNIGPRDQDLILQVAEHPDTEVQLSQLIPNEPSAVRVAHSDPSPGEAEDRPAQFDGETYLEIADADALDMQTQDFSITARIRTQADGSIFSMSDGGSSWVPNGQTFFVRDGRLAFDIGWVGAAAGKTRVDDGQWHTVAVTWEQATGRVRLYRDGQLDGEGRLAAKAALPRSVARIGFTSPNFPQPESFFRGEISQLSFHQHSQYYGQEDVSDQPVEPESSSTTDSKRVGEWVLEDQLGQRVRNRVGNGLDGQVRRGPAPIRPDFGPIIAGFAPRETDAQWILENGSLRLKIPAGDAPLSFSVWMPCSPGDMELPNATAGSNHPFSLPVVSDAAVDLAALTRGGPPRWSQVLTTQPVIGSAAGPFAVDVLTPPESNPWLALTRFTGHDFYPDGRIAICTWDGDIWIVTPTQEAETPLLKWQRIGSGLFQPLGLKIVNNRIHLICRDQLVVLHDLNGDGETDFYECLNNDHQVTEHFHEFAMGLQTDAQGNFYYAKSGCHGKAAVVPHHGTLLRISPDGAKTEILANGFRAANGVCLNPDGSFVVTDQEGYWNPKNRINWVTVTDLNKPNFYGNMLGYHDVTDRSDAAMVPPLCWITNDFDRSPAELLWVDSDRWGPLRGELLNLSYGYGKVFLVLHEEVNGSMQGGMIELPIPSFPTGVMRGRFHPLDGQLYLSGMFAWAGNATHPGGFYRVRYTGQPLGLVTELKALDGGLELKFSEQVHPESAREIQNYELEAWDLKRTEKYGSEHFNQRRWAVESAELLSDGTTVRLRIPEIAPTWGMQLIYRVRAADGRLLQGKIHNTIHQLRSASQ